MSGKLIPLYTPKKSPKDDFEIRMERIRASMDKINKLLSELKEMSADFDLGPNDERD